MLLGLALQPWRAQSVIYGLVDPALRLPWPWLDGLLRWDAHWYSLIAREGYNSHDIVMMPLLPGAMAALGTLGLSLPAAGLLVCNTAFLAAAGLLYTLARRELGSERLAMNTLWTLCLLPTSFFFNSIYTEAPFLALSLACALSARQGRFVAAGLWVALATLTRNLGIFLELSLLAELWLQSRERGQPFFTAGYLGRAALALAPAPLALAAYAAYNYHLTGDALAFVHHQAEWGRYFGWPWTSIARSGLHLWRHLPGVILGHWLDLLYTLLWLAALGLATLAKRFALRPTWLLLLAVWLAVPLCSTTAWSPLLCLARYSMIIFPFYFIVARLPLAWLRIGWVAGALGLVVSTLWFSKWWWVG